MYRDMMRQDVEHTAIRSITCFPLSAGLPCVCMVSSLLWFLGGILFALCLVVGALVSLRAYSSIMRIAVAVSWTAVANEQQLRKGAVDSARLVNADGFVLILLCSNVLFVHHLSFIDRVFVWASPVCLKLHMPGPTK